MNIDYILSYITEILIAIFAIVVLFQIFYYLLLFIRFSHHKPKIIAPHSLPPVSIVMVAKNDAYLLLKTLPEIFTQEYPQFEVVIVNDNSSDETPQLVLDFQNRFPNLKLVHLDSSVTNIKGKKFPLSLGIKSASYEHILVTDTDCVPASNQWLKLMMRHFSDTTQIVLGYCKLKKNRGILNALIRFDRLHQAIQYFSYCIAKIPFMGMGQNLAYTKALFFKHKGFASQNHLQFGDDDLFVHRAATTRNCAMEYSKEAHTISRFGSNFHHWFLLKIFRSKTRRFYRRPNSFLLNFYHFLITFSYITLAFALYFSSNNLFYVVIVLGILLLKLLTQYIIFGFAAAKLDEKRLVPHILFFDIIFAMMNPVIYFIAKIKK